MAIPEKREDLVAMGYVYDNDARCSGADCHQMIEWWITPKGAKMPMSVVDEKDETKAFPQPVLRTIRVPHWSVCPNAKDFKRGKK
jgi:hypothetical protein